MAAAKQQPQAVEVASEDAASQSVPDSQTGGPYDDGAVIAPIAAVPPFGSTYRPAPDSSGDTIAQIEDRA